MAKAKVAPLRRREERTAEWGGEGPLSSRHHPLVDLLGRTAFEVAIVAVGVFLALAVGQRRERSEEHQLAAEARTALRAEIVSNREAILARMRRTAKLYGQVASHPDQVGQFVVERRNGPLLLNDGAWTMTVQTGAMRWLEPDERASFAEIYAGQQRMRDVVSEEMARWTELAAFPSRPASVEGRDSRDRAIRVWQAFAQRAQLALCVNAGRHERALGARVPDEQLGEFCTARPPDEDPGSIYRDWKRFGWVSAHPPRLLTDDSRAQ